MVKPAEKPPFQALNIFLGAVIVTTTLLCVTNRNFPMPFIFLALPALAIGLIVALIRKNTKLKGLLLFFPSFVLACLIELLFTSPDFASTEVEIVKIFWSFNILKFAFLFSSLYVFIDGAFSRRNRFLSIGISVMALLVLSSVVCSTVLKPVSGGGDIHEYIYAGNSPTVNVYLSNSSGSMEDKIVFSSSETLYAYQKGLFGGLKYGFRLMSADNRELVPLDTSDYKISEGQYRVGGYYSFPLKDYSDGNYKVQLIFVVEGHAFIPYSKDFTIDSSKTK